MSAHTIKNCPFCGGKDPSVAGVKDHMVFVRYKEPHEKGFSPYWAVECDGCCSEGRPCATEAEAIAAWNERPIERELLEALEWAVDTLKEINPSNYNHDDVCDLNAASVEVILGLQPLIAKAQEKSDGA